MILKMARDSKATSLDRAYSGSCPISTLASILF